jgi:hypothetical protein
MCHDCFFLTKYVKLEREEMQVITDSWDSIYARYPVSRYNDNHGPKNRN